MGKVYKKENIYKTRKNTEIGKTLKKLKITTKNKKEKTQKLIRKQ